MATKARIYIYTIYRNIIVKEYVPIIVIILYLGKRELVSISIEWITFSDNAPNGVSLFIELHASALGNLSSIN